MKPKDLPDAAERIVEDQIPSHLPLQVELMNLEVEPLLRNLEVKVTNISNKPIYYLKLSVLLPDVLSPDGNPIIFPLRYGRTDLIDFDEPLRPDDAPIKPGESYVFKIPEENLQPFERLAAKKKLSRSEITVVYLLFHLLNFGDKTGFSSTDGPLSLISARDKPRMALVKKGLRKVKPSKIRLVINRSPLPTRSFRTLLPQSNLTYVALAHPALT